MIRGNVTAEEPGSILTVSELGRIEGEVRVPDIVLNGMVQGDVFSSEHIELATKAHVEGNVFYNLMEVAMGAEVNGSLVHNKLSVPPPENPRQASLKELPENRLPGPDNFREDREDEEAVS
jgi:cytoskeletal protein CcmA (bactofilin family)